MPAPAKRKIVVVSLSQVMIDGALCGSVAAVLAKQPELLPQIGELLEQREAKLIVCHDREVGALNARHAAALDKLRAKQAAPAKQPTAVK